MLEHSNAVLEKPPIPMPKSTIERSAIIAVFDTHLEAEDAVQLLQKSGFDMKKLSIVGQGYHTEEAVVGYYTAGDRMMSWGKSGAFWGAIWGLLFGSGFFLVPGIGPLLAAGPIVVWIVAALEGAAVLGGLSALGAALLSIGIPEDSILEYETQIKAGKFLIVAQESPEDIIQSREILENSKHRGLKRYSCHD